MVAASLIADIHTNACLASSRARRLGLAAHSAAASNTAKHFNDAATRLQSRLVEATVEM
jgi:hypothetical protein